MDSAYADQNGKVSGMAAGAATVIGAVMIRADLDRTRGLDGGDAAQDEQDQQNAAHFVPVGGLRRESARDAHTYIYSRR